MLSRGLLPQRGTVMRRALPAPGAPLVQVWPLGTERGVVAVPRVEPRLVRQVPEHLGFPVVHQGPEVPRACCPPRTPREERVAGEQVRIAGGVVVQQGDRAWGVAGQ